MRRYSFCSLFVAGVLALGGCSAGISAPGSSSSMQRELDQLKMEVADLKDRSGGGYSSSGSSSDISQLKADVMNIQERLGRLENQAHLAPLPGSGSSGGGLAAVPVVTGVPAASSNSTPPPPPPLENAYENQPGDPYAAAQGLEPEPSSPAVQTAYDQGKTLFDQKNYNGAIGKFKEQLASEPGGKNAPASQFYIGESLFAQQKYEDAILEYQKVVKGYPKSSQVSTALLKQGISFQSIGDKTSAKLLYQKVVSTYPKSYAAGVAKERLKNI